MASIVGRQSGKQGARLFLDLIPCSIRMASRQVHLPGALAPRQAGPLRPAGRHFLEFPPALYNLDPTALRQDELPFTVRESVN